jgi:hypothetical protein
MKLWALLKWGVKKGEHFRKGGQGNFVVRRFTKVTKINKIITHADWLTEWGMLRERIEREKKEGDSARERERDE